MTTKELLKAVADQAEDLTASELNDFTSRLFSVLYDPHHLQRQLSAEQLPSKLGNL